MVSLIGAPFDRCGRRAGSRLGPEAVRLAGLEESLEEIGVEVCDQGNLSLAFPEDKYDMAASTAEAIRASVARELKAARTPLVLGGDHSISIGSISAALAEFGDDLAVLWIDAHADINHPGTSPSGNMHGMPLGALLGLNPDANAGWKRLLTAAGEVKLRQNRIAWLGLREVDEGEVKTIASLDGCFASTMQDIDRFGLDRVIKGFENWLEASGAKALWISFDVDVLDPAHTPGTGTAVLGGLTYREGHLCAELLHDFLKKSTAKLVGLDVVEVNPLFDRENRTARMAVAWVGSLFGKTILGPGREPAG